MLPRRRQELKITEAFVQVQQKSLMSFRWKEAADDSATFAERAGKGLGRLLQPPPLVKK
jgi:hypothetical protein